MATKINTTYYGAESSWTSNSSWGSDCKRADSQHTFLKLAQNGDLDLANEGNINFTAVPWGVPRCSMTNHSYPLHLAASPDGAFKGFYKPINEDLDDKNNPLVIVSGGGNDISYESGQSTTNARAYQKRRVIGKTAVSGNNLVSTLGADNGTNINSGAAYGESVITYLNYQTTKVIIDKVYLIDKDSVVSGVTATNGNLLTVSFDYLTSEAYEDKWICVGVSCKFVVNNNLASDGTLHPVFANPHKTPLHIRNNYSNDTMQTWVQYHRNVIKSLGRTDSFNVNQTSSNYVTYADANTKASNSAYACGPYSTMYCNTSAKEQVFDDVSYKWDMRARWASGNIVLWLKDGEALTDSVKWYNVLDIPDNSADRISQAIMHEVAFLGFPFVISSEYVNEPIGSNKVFLPVFDYEHMITTGNYVNGAASLQLNNALWGNIFDDNIPNWDPTYVPPEGDQNDEDRGDLTNSTRNRYSNAGGLAQWVVTQQTLLSLQAFLNGTYLPTAEDLDADFKGTNPQQYIVSVQKYPYDIPYQGTSGTIYIGRNSTSLSGYKLFADWGGVSVLPINAICTEDFGTIQIPRYYDDFRDYLSKIILFLPFIGTAELDPRLYIGHSVGLIYTIDYNTGSVCAEIKRDGLTMETKTATISITIPFMAADMGSYQNALAQLDYSKELTKIKGVQTALTTGFQIGSAALGAYNSGGVPGLGQLSAIAAGGAQLAANGTTLDYIDYQIEHTAPSVGTISTASAANAFFMDARARILIIRPSMLAGYDPAEYSHTVGNACCRTGRLADFSGYTLAAAAVLNSVTTKGSSPRAANEQELQALRRALLNGVYL